MRQQQRMGNHRSTKQIKEHYEIERKLANRLRTASKQERRYLYSSLYDELFRLVPLHPQLTRKKSSVETTQIVEVQMKFLRPFLNKDITFLEIGPGDCSLSFELAKYVKQVYAVDVSDEITKAVTTPHNFQLILSDGCSIPVTHNNVNVAYSNQLMEHLHPEDAYEQLQNIYNTLVPGGSYICITPNRLTGPHDVSKYFDLIATGFHLKEYTHSELNTLFKTVGFKKVKVYVRIRGGHREFPFTLLRLFEGLLTLLPLTIRKPIVNNPPFRMWLNSHLVGMK